MREPIFVVGTGRSGSTVFFDCLAKHPQVAWLSRVAGEQPERLWADRLLMAARGYPFLDTVIGKHYGPSESYPFWDHVFAGFSNPCRDLMAEDVTPAAATRAHAAVTRLVSRSRNRFLAKITGWPRVRFLHELFPGAFFIEVTRDPRAVASSLLEVPFWDGWRGPPNWRRGPLPDDLAAIWRDEQRSFVALAAIECVIAQRALDDCRAAVPARFHRVSYSNLCANTVEIFRQVAVFCHLDWSPRFEKAIRAISLIDQSDKWTKNLSVAQQAVLQRVFDRAQLATTGRTDE